VPRVAGRGPDRRVPRRGIRRNRNAKERGGVDAPCSAVEDMASTARHAAASIPAGLVFSLACATNKATLVAGRHRIRVEVPTRERRLKLPGVQPAISRETAAVGRSARRAFGQSGRALVELGLIARGKLRGLREDIGCGEREDTGGNSRDERRIRRSREGGDEQASELHTEVTTATSGPPHEITDSRQTAKRTVPTPWGWHEVARLSRLLLPKSIGNAQRLRVCSGGWCRGLLRFGVRAIEGPG
jgi:hypothetical protein